MNVSSHALSKVQRLPDWPSYYISSTTGTKDNACKWFRTPQSEVSVISSQVRPIILKGNRSAKFFLHKNVGIGKYNMSKY